MLSNAVEGNLSLYVNSMEKVEVDEILKAQKEEEDIREIVAKRQAEKDVDASLVKGDAKLMLRERKILYLDDKGILRRRPDLHAQLGLT